MSLLKFSNNLVRAVVSHGIAAIKNIQYFSRWKSTFVPGSSPVKARLPWITFAAIDCLSASIKPGHKVFEYGGGGSTLFFLEHGCNVITVEHDEEWFNNIHKEINEKSGSNWTGCLILAEKAEGNTGSLSWEAPQDFYSNDELFRSSVFANYVKKIAEYPDEYFDVVLIDGRARTSCMFYALNKVKKGGLLVLDNSDRAYYTKWITKELDNFKVEVDSYGPVPHLAEFSKTTIWKRVQ